MNGKQLKNSILQLAIQGKLVPQDANDEPAIGLLKRHNPKIKPITEDVPFEVPESWVWVKLGDVITLLSGRDLEPEKYNKVKKGIPYITGASNFENGNLLINRWTEEPITISKKGDLLLTCKGTIGSMAFNDIGDIHIARQIMAINSNFANLLYIQNFLNLNVNSLEAQANSIIPGISRNVLLKTNIPIPPLAEQKRIVAKIEELMPLVERYTKAQEGLDKLNAGIKGKLRASILQEAIQGRLVPQDANDEPAIGLLKKINPKFVQPNYDEELPEGWSVCKLKDCGVSILNGYAFKSNEYTDNGIRVIRITNVQDGNIVDNDPKFYSLEREVELDKYLLKENDLLMSLTGNVGRVGFLPFSLLPAALNQRVACLRFGKDSISKLYLFYFLQTYSFRTNCVNSGKGSAQLNISTEWLKNYIIPLPPLAEQKRIVEKIEELFGVLNRL